METFTEQKALSDNPNYKEQREKNLAGLTDGMIDEPIIEIINSFNGIPYCFTLQSCYGHFVHSGQTGAHNMDPLPSKIPDSKVEYRIAYIAFCIENNDNGRLLSKIQQHTVVISYADSVSKRDEKSLVTLDHFLKSYFPAIKGLKALEEIPVMAPEHIQFGSAEWFWKRQVNSYALQVEPERFKHQDRAMLDYEEALTIEKTRNEFFMRLRVQLIGFYKKNVF